MSGKMVGFWRNAFHATFEKVSSVEDRATEEVMAETVGAVVTAYLKVVAANPAVIAIISITNDEIIVAQVIAQINGTKRTIYFTAGDEAELMETSVAWALQVVAEMMNGQ
jgi:hypothetical protein